MSNGNRRTHIFSHHHSHRSHPTGARAIKANNGRRCLHGATKRLPVRGDHSPSSRKKDVGARANNPSRHSGKASTMAKPSQREQTASERKKSPMRLAPHPVCRGVRGGAGAEAGEWFDARADGGGSFPAIASGSTPQAQQRLGVNTTGPATAGGQHNKPSNGWGATEQPQKRLSSLALQRSWR